MRGMNKDGELMEKGWRRKGWRRMGSRRMAELPG